MLNRRLVAALLILILITASLAFAQENKKENDVLKLSLKDAVKLAEENNQQVKLSELNLEKAKLGRQRYRYQDRKTRELEDEIKRAIEEWKQLPEDKQRELEEQGLKPVDLAYLQILSIHIQWTFRQTNGNSSCLPKQALM